MLRIYPIIFSRCPDTSFPFLPSPASQQPDTCAMFLVKIKTTTSVYEQLLSARLRLAATQSVTDCCLWSGSKLQHPTRSHLTPSNMQLKLFPSHAEDMTQPLTPPFQPQLWPTNPQQTSNQQVHNRHALLLLVTIRTSTSQTLQAKPPRSQQCATSIPSSLLHLQPGTCREGSRPKPE